VHMISVVWTGCGTECVFVVACARGSMISLLHSRQVSACKVLDRQSINTLLPAQVCGQHACNLKQDMEACAGLPGLCTASMR